MKQTKLFIKGYPVFVSLTYKDRFWLFAIPLDDFSVNWNKNEDKLKTEIINTLINDNKCIQKHEFDEVYNNSVLNWTSQISKLETNE